MLTGGTVARGYQRMAMRRMQGPPAALYPRVPTNATAIKSIDTGTELTVLSTTTSPQVLVVPKLGSAYYQRLGNRTRGISLQIIGKIQPTFSNTAAIACNLARIIVYYDRQPNGANPAISDILLDQANGGTATDAYSMINMNNRDRFMILRDRKVYLPEIAADGVVGNLSGGVVTDPNAMGSKGLLYVEFIKLNGLESLYNSTNGGTIGDISAGAFGLLAINEDSSGTPGWCININTRFKWLD